MVLILFRSKLTDVAGDDYTDMLHWYDSYIIEVADLVRSQDFRRTDAA